MPMLQPAKVNGSAKVGSRRAYFAVPEQRFLTCSTGLTRMNKSARETPMYRARTRPAMNRIRTLRILVAVACSVSFTVPAFGQSKHWEELQDLPFRENYPTADSTERLYDEMLFHRSTQVLQWSLPAMTLWAMKKGSEKQFGEGSHVFPIWKDRLTSDTLVSTPNCDVIYGMGYLDLKKDGPTVIEVPPKLQGMLDDFWHRPLCDVGFVGPDRGAGGKYLILPLITKASHRRAISRLSPARTTFLSFGEPSETRAAIRSRRWR